ncbi:hypothetical protein HZC35_06655 [Candidatus Saganbacteria bacterium]|nr:hypothetical protein [Candidatus Saganbacteria bacterium]
MGIVRWMKLKLTTPEPLTMGSRMSRRTFLGIGVAAAAGAGIWYLGEKGRVISPPSISSAHEVEPTRRLLERFELGEGKLLEITRDRIKKSILAQVKGNEDLGGYFLIKPEIKVVNKSNFLGFKDLQINVWDALVGSGYIDGSGKILPKFDGTKEKFGLGMPLSSGSVDQVFDILQNAPMAEPVYFIHSPTQFGQIVSEGMGYWMKILTNAARRLDPTKEEDKVLLRKYQETFNGLVRGTIAMINDNPSGLPGWRCYYNPELKKIEFRSKQEQASATDADLYIADALMDAELLANEGIFEPSPEFQYRGKKLGYTGLTNHMASRIKAYDVEEMNGRHILRVSDMWGSRDFKGALTYNPSYARLSVLYRIAQRDIDRDFWLKLRFDSFELINESYKFARDLYGKMMESKQIIKGTDREGNEVEWVKLDGPEARLLESLMVKLTPQKDAELKALINEKNEDKKILEYREDHLAFVEGQSVRANLDGSRDIRKDVYDLVIKKIEEYQVKLFFPDQVEVEVNEKGEYLLRPEIGAPNLDFTEGYDAIRIYAELGEDLLMNNDSLDERVPEEYRVSGREHLLLEDILGKGKKAGDPKLVRAGRYHNAVALSAYFMARAGLATYEEAEIAPFDKFRDELEAYISPIRGGSRDQTDIFDFINQQDKRGPQYYNASLALKILTSFLARDKEYSAQAVPLEKVSRIPAERDIQDEEPMAPVYTGAHEDLDYLLRTTATDFKRPAEYLTQDIPEINREVRGTPPSEPIFTAEAERRYFHAKDNLRSDSPKSQYEFGKACLSVGRYREAAQVYFELLKTAPSPNKPIDELIITESIRRLTDILGTLNMPQPIIEDLFEWLLSREKQPGKKTALLRLAFIHQLNQNRRITRALAEEDILMGEIDLYFGQGTAFDGAVDRIRGFLLSGDNGHAPLPSYEILAQAVAEVVFSYANTYKIEDDRFGFPRKVYNREGARLLANLAVTEGRLSHAPVTDPTLQKLVEWVKAVKDRIPANTRSRILLAEGSIFHNAAYQEADDIKSLTALSHDWRNYYYSDDLDIDTMRSRGDDLKNGYEKALHSLDNALEYYYSALRHEISQAANTDMLTEILDGILSANKYKVKILADQRDVKLRYELKIVKKQAALGETNEATTNLIRPIFKKAVNIVITAINADQPLSGEDIETIRTIANKVNNKIKLTEAEEVRAIAVYYRVDKEGKLLDPREKALLDYNYNTKTIKLFYENNIAIIVRKTERMVVSVLNNFAHPASVRMSEMIRIGNADENLEEELLGQAIKLIVNGEDSADPRNIKWNSWVRRALDMYHGFGIHNLDTQYFEDALDSSQIITNIWLSSRSLFALNIVETSLKLAEILFGYRNLSNQSDLIDLEKELAIMQEQKNDMECLFQALLIGPSFQPQKEPSNRIRTFINEINKHWEVICQVYEADPTLQAKILTQYGNLMFWGVDVELRLKEKETGEEDHDLTDMQVSTLNRALETYQGALAIDPYSIDALSASIIINYKLKNRREAFYFLVRSLRIMSSSYVPAEKENEIFLRIGMFAKAKKPTDTTGYVPFDENMIRALNNAAKYAGEVKEINVYHLQNILEFFRSF